MQGELRIETKVQAGQHTNWREMNGEAVVVDFNSGNYYVLDDVTSFFWRQAIDKPISISSIIAATIDEYEIDSSTVEENAKNFCAYMIAEKMLTLAQ